MRLDLTSYSSILATAAEGEGSTKVGMSMKEDTTYSILANRENTTATADISPQLPSLPPVTDVIIAGLLTRPRCTEHDAEHTAVGHASSSDVEVPSSFSPTPVLSDFLRIPIGALLPSGSAVALSKPASFSLDSHSQMLASAASGPSRSWDPSAAVEGEASAKTGLWQEMGKDESDENNTLTSDDPM